MTLLLYRLDDKVTASYSEYLENKDQCKEAYTFYVEGVDKDADTPSTYAEVERYAKRSFFI